MNAVKPEIIVYHDKGELVMGISDDKVNMPPHILCAYIVSLVELIGNTHGMAEEELYDLIETIRRRPDRPQPKKPQ